MTTHTSSDLPANTTGRRLPGLWVVLVALGGVGLAIVCGLAFIQEGTDTALLIGVVFVFSYSLVAGGVWLTYRLVRDLHRLGKLRTFLGVGIPLFLVGVVGYVSWRANATAQSMVINRGDLVGGLAFALASWYAFGQFLKR